MADSSSTDDSLNFEALSALADGQADGTQTAQVLDAWRRDPQMLAHWQAYHVVGDAMRSDVPLVTISSDAAFLGRLNERLAHEPVVFAPAALPPNHVLGVRARDHATTRHWGKPIAIAASFVIIMGGLLGLLQGGLPGLNRNLVQVAVGGGVAPASTVMAMGQSQQVNTNGKPWPVDANWTTALAADFPPNSGQAPHGLSRISFVSGAPTRTMSWREDQSDAFWHEMPAHQAQGDMVPVAFSLSAP
jgi:Anti sigma-E protein RseA, N-terminal domain